MASVYTDFVSGTLQANINNSQTTFVSAGLTALSAVGGTDIAKIVLDPFGANGAPEIVYVSGHTAASDTVTAVQRGQEGTSPRPHNSGTLLLHVPTATDFRDIRTDLGNIKTSPGTVLATAAPVDLVAGGGAQPGSGISVSRSDHRHALSAGSPSVSAPGDTSADGAATSVARSDHRHSRESFATTIADVSTSSPGAASTVARGDHQHAIGAGALTSYTQLGSGLQATSVVANAAARPTHSKGRQVLELDTNRRYESDGTNWLRREVLSGDSTQTGVSLSAVQTLSSSVLTRITTLNVNASRDTDSYRRDSQYSSIPAGLAGLYLVEWTAVMNDGSAPAWLEAIFTLTTAVNGIGINARYSGNNGTKSFQASGSKYLNLVSGQYVALDVQHQAGSAKQVNMTVDLFLLKNTGA